MIFKNEGSRRKFRLSVAVICIIGGILSLPEGALMIGVGCLYGYKGIRG
ncbi:MAG: hypothetical protein H7Y18_17925 [Clostridiaceae bacterium]|nr:hypothetical protein [Clostridiaceae bacterium]